MMFKVLTICGVLLMTMARSRWGSHANQGRYLALRTQAGYPNIKPKFRLFELGWETWASLGWRANAATVQEELSRLLTNGFPIRWAVTGSGFWIEGGTTTSFGQFGEKFPDPESLKSWLHDRNIKWLIGLRTNFVPSADRLNQNSRSAIAISKAITTTETLFRRAGPESPFVDGSQERTDTSYFTVVPASTMLPTRRGNEAAARWYADQYKLWGVDGIKEDTMMNCNFGIFDGPIGTIANGGALVMARCGSFSAPGTLLRINDTTGVAEMDRRPALSEERVSLLQSL